MVIAAAIVTTASCTPRMRTAGNPSSRPTITATAMPASAANGQGSPGPETATRLVPCPPPLAIILAMKNAAIPASDICTSEIWPV